MKKINLFIIVIVDFDYVNSPVDCWVVEEDSLVCSEDLWDTCRNIGHAITTMNSSRIKNIDKMNLRFSRHVCERHVIENDRDMLAWVELTENI